MKKIILPMCMLAMIACSKEETKTTTNNNTSITFNKENLVGTWNIDKLEGYTTSNDSLTLTFPFTKGSATVAFNADNSFITKSPFGNAEGTFSIIKLNGKDVLITTETGDPSDTCEISTFTASTLIFDDRAAEIRANDDSWSKTYCSK